MQFVDRCADAPIAQLRGTIEELMDQTWDPRAEVAVFRAKHSEGAVGNDLLLGPLDGLPWAYARRAAQRMCLNRGFLAGVATGHHTPGDSYEVMCFGPGGRFYDASQAEVDATGHGYTSPDATGWARAGRVAAGLCAQKHPGSPGGFMTGYRREGFGLFPALMGVFCLDGDAARWPTPPPARWGWRAISTRGRGTRRELGGGFGGATLHLHHAARGVPSSHLDVSPGRSTKTRRWGLKSRRDRDMIVRAHTGK